jgi:2-C-methyl-D-erythritol 4-phosphate cytidylyltransferase
MYKSERVGAVIVAAGESRRMNGVDKIYAPIGGKPVIVRTVSVFQTSEFIDQIALVVSEPNLTSVNKLIKDEGCTKVCAVVAGGERRQDSVAAGLKALHDCPWVVIHDGARPLMPRGLILSGLIAAEDNGAAVAAVPVTDTIKVVADDMMVRETPPRRFLWTVQTPQIFRFAIIYKAYLGLDREVTDDASLVEQMGFPVRLFMGSYDNIKITTPTDLVIAEVLWSKRGAAELSA